MEERLQKILAQAGYGSRRECEAYITAGRVRVNGQVATLGAKADPDRDAITLDGTRVRLEKLIYIALNKPKGVLSSTEDELQEGRQTVRDLIALPGHLYPVGRLDRQSRGLMLLTNDGDLAHKLTHPRYGHEKEYKVLVEGVPSEEALAAWREGVFLEGKRTRRAQVEVARVEKDKTFLTVVLREGRKRQIRKVGAMLGHPVKQLTRERIGTLSLQGLRPGEWRHLTDAEVAALKKSVAAPAKRPSSARRGQRRGGKKGSSGKPAAGEQPAGSSAPQDRKRRRPDKGSRKPRPPRPGSGRSRGGPARQKR